jgi:Uma2 family endonuclease
MLGFGPDLAIEVLSPSNTPQEMERKLNDYFRARVRVVWYVDPRQRTVEVFTGVDRSTLLREGQTLTGDPLLPGFNLALRDLFAQLAD